MKNFGLTVLTAFLGGAMAIGTYKVIENNKESNMSFEDRQKVYFASNHEQPVVSSTGNVDFTEAAAAVTPAVVYIRTTYSATSGSGGQDEMEQMFGQMFGQRARPQGVQKASGSGVIISTDGYIVTNNHVVEKADKIEVTTNDKRVFQAKVIGTDPNTDLALIKISGSNLPIVKLGNSDDARVGEWVLAVGNPFNLTSTVTAGIISAKGRNIGIIGSNSEEDQNPFGRTRLQSNVPKLNKGIESFIQTDAAINPGNSGGALVNTKGELIGINAAIASQTGSYEGYGFAIPVNLAKKVLNDIQKYGSVKRGLVGVSFTELNPDAAQQLGTDHTVGLYVNDLVAGGAAQAAGLQKGDIISKVNGHTVTESSDLQETVGRLHPGDKIDLTVIRGSGEKNFSVTLKAETPDSHLVVNRSAEELYNKLGAGFQALNESQKAKYGVKSGVVVTQVRPGKMFDDLGVEVGSVITSINNMAVNAPADIDKALTNLHNGNLKISGIDPQGQAFNNVYTVR